MASTQADVLLTSPILMPGEDKIAASNLRTQRRSGGNNLLPSSSYPARNTRNQKIGAVETETSVTEDISPALTSSLLRQNKQQAVGSLKGLAKQAIDQVVAPAIQQATSKLLQQAWFNAIETYGLTLLYVNVHVFLRWVIGEKYFCKLGDEWLSKIGSKGTVKSGSAASFLLGLPARGVGLLEVGLIGALDIILLLAVLVSIALPGLIVYLIVNPTEAAQLIGISALIDLIEAAF